MNPSETTLETIFGLTILGLKIGETPYLAFGYIDDNPIQRIIAPYGLGKISFNQARFPQEFVNFNKIINVTYFSLYNRTKNENEFYEIHESYSTTPKIIMEKVSYKDYSEMVDEITNVLNKMKQKIKIPECQFPASVQRKLPSARVDSMKRRLH